MSNINFREDNKNLQFEMPNSKVGRISEHQLDTYLTIAKNMVGVLQDSDDFEGDNYTLKLLMGIRGKQKGSVAINPIPTLWVTNPICVVIDERNGRDPSLPIPAQMIKALKKAGIPVHALALRYDEDRSLILSDRPEYYGETAKKFEVMDPHGFEEIYFEPASLNAIKNTVFYSNLSQDKYSIKFGAKVSNLMFLNFEEHLAIWLARQVEELSTEQVVKLLKELVADPEEGYDPEEDNLPSNMIKIESFGYKTSGLIAEFKDLCDVKFTLNNQEWSLNSASSMFGKLFSAKTMAFMFILSLTCGRQVSDKTIGGYLAASSALWQVDNTTYGRTPQHDEILSVVQRNTIKSIKAVSMNPMGDSRRFPYIQFVSDKFDTQILEELASQQIPFMPDKNAKDRVIFGAGAEAMGVFFVSYKEAMADPFIRAHVLHNFEDCVEVEGGFLILFFDTAARKLFNRHSQAFGGSTADTSDPVNYPIKRSLVRYKTSEGEAAVYGFSGNFIISNSGIQSGSGAAIARNSGLLNKQTGKLGGFFRPYQIDKTMSNNIAAHQISKPVTDMLKKKAASSNSGDRWLEQMIPLVEKKLDKVVGKTFENGEVILKLFEGDELRELDLLVHQGYNQEIKINGYDVSIDSVFYQLNVKLYTSLNGADDCIKIRIPGGKMTLESGNLEILRHDESPVDDYSEEWLANINGPKGWEVMLPYETQKDQLLRLHAFINAMGGGVIDRNFIILDEKDDHGHNIIVNLLNPDNEYEIWLEQVTKLVYFKRTISTTFWNDLLKRNAKYTVCDISTKTETLVGYDIVEINETEVTIMEPVQIIYAPNMIWGMEISSAHENVTFQAMTGEMVAAMSAFDFNSAADIWGRASFYHQGVVKLVDMMTMGFDLNPKAKVFGIEDYKTIQKWIIKVDDDGRTAPRTGRELFKYLARQYPKGFGLSVPFNGKDNPIFVVPDAVMGVGAFGNGGSATGLVKDLIDLMRAYAVDPSERSEFWESSLRGNTARVKAGWETWSGMRPRGGMVDSKSILGKLGASAKEMVSGKIMNSMSPDLSFNPETDLPIVILNPECDIARNLKVKNGSIIGMIRVPMIMPVFCEVKLLSSAKRSYATMLGYVWAMGNEGDCDGDGFSSFKTKLSKEKAMFLNKHLLSAGGYEYCYKKISDQPFSEFISFKDAWGKKMLNGEKIPFAIKPFAKFKAVNQIRFIPALMVKEYADKISLHYGVAVGTSYGWCSMASFMAAESTYKAVEELSSNISKYDHNTEEGMEVLQRMIMEGPAYMTKLVDADGNPISYYDYLNDNNHTDRADQFLKLHKQHLLYSKVNAVCWRLIYEGLGLSGYTSKASMFFSAISFMVRNETKKLVVVDVCDKDGKVSREVDVTVSVETANACGIDGYTFISEEFDIPLEIVPVIINLEKYRSTYRAMEKYGKNAAIARGESVATIAAKYGMLRRTTQGSTFVDFLNDDAEGNGYSTFSFMASNLSEGQGIGFTNPILIDMATNGVIVHNNIIDAKKRYAEIDS